jgi:hypothetical protein
MRELQDFMVNVTLLNVHSHIVGAAMFQSFFDRVADVILCLVLKFKVTFKKPI